MSCFGDIMSAIFGSKASRCTGVAVGDFAICRPSPSAALSAPGTVDVAAILDKADEREEAEALLAERSSI